MEFEGLSVYYHFLDEYSFNGSTKPVIQAWPPKLTRFGLSNIFVLKVP